MSLAVPTLLTLLSAAFFLTLERLRPGRELPHAPGWYLRALLINGCQAAITFATNGIWYKLAAAGSLLTLRSLNMPVLEGFIGWFVGTFFFYWWHRLRHEDGFGTSTISCL